MRRFTRLYTSLDQTTSTNAKVAALVDYFREAPDGDAAWALQFLSGKRLKRLIGPALLREWLVDAAGLPAWLVEESYTSVGDLAETIALLMDDGTRDAAPFDTSLARFVEDELLPLRDVEVDAQRERVVGWWRRLDAETCFVVNKLLTGALRVGVSKVLVARAVAEAAGLERDVVMHRLMGRWTPSAEAWRALVAPDDGAADVARPYPFCLAHALPNDAELDDSLGPASGWQAEWKWDGIRCQLVRRDGQTFLWSRGGELVDERFPEVVDAAAGLPDGTVLDGELLAWREPDGVLPFAELQRRIGRKTVGRKLLADVPVVLLAYDLLELDGVDLRELATTERRARLDALAASHTGAFRTSPVLPADSWDALAAQRAESRARRVEGLMLKRTDAPYDVGRKTGTWWKWKVEPYTVDAVLIYAQAGHGRRSNLFTDYTFAVWRDDELVPIAKAYSGLDDKEITELDRWIRRHTNERFGPVRSVEAQHVFELAFEGVASSKRHKSGVAVRFPRIARWRRDLSVKDADTLDAVRALAEEVP